MPPHRRFVLDRRGTTAVQPHKMHGFKAFLPGLHRWRGPAPGLPMRLTEAAVAILLGISQLLGVPVDPRPQLQAQWTVAQAFDGTGQVRLLDASTLDLPQQCRKNPQGWLRFPGVVHGAQELQGDGRLLLRHGDPTFATTRAFFGGPHLACSELQDVQALRWLAWSPTRYFARVAFAPQWVARRPADLFWGETVNAVAGGSLLAIAVLSALIFAGKVSGRLALSLTLANLSMAVYFSLATAGLFGLGLPMVTAHRMADAAVWIGFLFTAACLQLQGVIGRRVLWAYVANVVPALGLVLLGQTGDVIQLGTTLPFASTILLLIYAFGRVMARLPTADRKLAPLGQAFGFGLFAVAGINDMLAVTGLTAAPMLLPLGVVGSLMFTAIAVNEGIVATYRERDYLRKNLELEVLRKTEELRGKSEALSLAHDKAERLLLNVLPRSIADRLKEDPKSIADGFDAVTVLFADVAGFTPLSAALPPADLVDFLNRLFSEFDRLAEGLGLEKIKTIGDAYMVAGGLPEPRADHALAVVRMGLAMAEVARAIRTPTGEALQLRIGINTGPVVAGVIGQRKFIYDLWGDTVNLASRMESHGIPGRVQITAATLLATGDAFHVEPRGAIDVKGKGKIEAYLLVGERAPV